MVTVTEDKVGCEWRSMEPLHHTVVTELEKGASLPILRINDKKHDGHGFISELASPRRL
jgi:hypothetical protein